MYWAYLILFVCMIMTPELTQDGVLFFSEDDFESLLIFCFGIVGLLLYLGKESAFLQAVREKLSLQQEANQIRKDLSQSYSYIGEMNRRIDIVKNMVVSLPRAKTPMPERHGLDLYTPIIEATKLLAQSECVALYFVALGDGQVLERYEVGEGEHREMLSGLDGQHLLGAKKYLWEEGKLSFVRSPEDAEGIAAFIVFHKLKNRLEETGIFQILAAQALFIFSVNRGASVDSLEAISHRSV
ncbi:MAG: hypothetical protein WAT81_03845 [Candidatus Moraniibacteriota bacterium]